MLASFPLLWYEEDVLNATIHLRKMNQEYRPQPIDTSRIELPPAVTELAELLARNAHEVWAEGRLKQGWRYGIVRDDVRKLHPDLIPYEELPEGEKLFDRRTAMETLRVLLALGYTILR